MRYITRQIKVNEGEVCDTQIFDTLENKVITTTIFLAAVACTRELNENENKRFIDPNAPAYPHGAYGQQTGTGITIRTMIAAGIMANISHEYQDQHAAARDAVEATDYLIQELNK